MERVQNLGKKWFCRDNLIITVLAGILIFVIALPTKKAEGEQMAKKTGQEEQSMTVVEQNSGTENDYERIQEEKLKAALSAMDGVGKVEVMLTFVSSEERVVEKEEPVSRSNTLEKDSEGGSRTVTQYEKGDATVYKTQSGESEPYVIKVLHPRVEGVLVVAEGAGDGTVNRSITEVAQALFGVEAHRVKVVPMGSKHISETGLIQ